MPLFILPKLSDGINEIELVKKVKNLGVYIDETLNFKENISNISYILAIASQQVLSSIIQISKFDR